MRTVRNTFPVLLVPQAFVSFPSAISAILAILALAFAAPARSQEPSYPMESIVQAPRNARQRQSNSTKHPQIITNADLQQRHPATVDPSHHFSIPLTLADHL